MLWFTSLVSKASNLPGIQAALKKAGVQDLRIVEMGQGQKQSRMVAWTFQDANARQAWRQSRWTAK
ncbi:Ribosomal RNA large subunit methyltransferase F [compost metagenome]